MSMAVAATTALLLARGCPGHALDTAADWLWRQMPADRPSGVVAQVDEAISIAIATDGLTSP